LTRKVEGIAKDKKANKALHRTAIPLRSIAAGELGRYVRNQRGGDG
jgi:hypothetical protein